MLETKNSFIPPCVPTEGSVAQRLTLRERAEAFATAFPGWPAAWPTVQVERERLVLYAVWMLGNDYRNRSDFYGAYPPGFLKRLGALFPDVPDEDILHVFSGSLPSGSYTRCDIRQAAELSCSVYDLPRAASRQFPLVIADPPYSAEDAKRYGTPMVNRAKALGALALVVPEGGYLAWLDTTWPMHSKRQWLTVGRICLVRSTNHRIRLLTIFERAAAV